MGALGAPVKILLNVGVLVSRGAQQFHNQFQGLQKVKSSGVSIFLNCLIGDNMKDYSSIARKDKSVFISVNFMLGAGYYLYTS